MKKYQTVIVKYDSTKLYLDKEINDLASDGYVIHSIIMQNIILMEKDIDDDKVACIGQCQCQEVCKGDCT